MLSAIWNFYLCGSHGDNFILNVEKFPVYKKIKLFQLRAADTITSWHPFQIVRLLLLTVHFCHKQRDSPYRSFIFTGSEIKQVINVLLLFSNEK